MKKPIFMIMLFVIISHTPVNARPLTLVADDDFAPFSFLDASGHAAGIDIDIIKEMAKRIDLKIDIELMPWKTLLSVIQSGARDGGMALYGECKKDCSRRDA